MAENSKQVGFIDEGRDLARRYREIVDELQDYAKRWGALYGSILVESDMPEQIIPSGTPATRLNSYNDVVGNMESIITTFDAGQDTNFERVSS